MKLIFGSMTFGKQVEANEAAAMLDESVTRGLIEIDTAYVYNGGRTEIMLGELLTAKPNPALKLAGKANPAAPGRLSASGIKEQLDTSLERLQQESLDLFYLHSPDTETAIDTTLEAINDAHEAGKIKKLGLSNYASWQVSQIYEKCEKNGWLKPVCYQGMYNAITRDVERELFQCLADYEIAFYVYNPLAGGLLSGKYHTPDSIPQSLPDSGRFSYHKSYPDRYWKDENHRAIAGIANACEDNGLSVLEAALGWLLHHSALATSTGWKTPEGSSADGSGVILGASSLGQLQQNLDACHRGPLPESVVDAIDEAWEMARPNCIKYFRP